MGSYNFPGVYIQELASPVHTITAAPTSIVAFVGYTKSGIDNRAQAIFSWGDFQRLYGGLTSNSEVSYAIQQFYNIAGSGAQAYIVRTPMHYATAGAVVFASVAFGAGSGNALTTLTFSALSSGQWANGQLLIDIDVQGLNLSSATGGDPLSFNLTVTNLTDGSTEYFPQLTLNPNAQNFVANVVNDIDNGSQLVSVAASLPTAQGVSPTALPVTGIVGTALVPTTVTTGSTSTTYLESVNSALGGGATTTIASADAGIVINMPGYTPGSVTAKVFSKGAPIPQTAQGLAAQLQNAINAQLAIVVKGGSVTCSAAPVGTAGNLAIRVNVNLPNAPDIVVAFAAPLAPLNDASVALGLNATQASPPTSEVAHYALGSSFANANPVANYTTTHASQPTSLPGTNELIGDPGSYTGFYALQKIPAFNLLCIPEAARALSGAPGSPDPSVNGPQIYSAAIALCQQMRAMLLIDPPANVTTVAGAVDWMSTSIGVFDPNGNGAAFWPRLRLSDPLSNPSNQLRSFAPSGVVAGVYARADGANRGPWVAAAGISATLDGVQNMTYIMNDAEQGQLNPLGLNCFRNFPIYGAVLWGARTIAGADAMASQWKYVPVRRTALFLESSLYQGTQWAVFSPNDERLWAALRLNIGAFMQTYFQLGAFQGTTPADAYFVKCDGETTTQTDIDNGVVNVLVGFAPLVPAEFVVIQIQQFAGQSSS
jgi:uncharacterized protein